MTDAEILKMCKSLAKRYKNYTEYEDLVSEGLLAIYERLDKEPYAQPARLYRVASTRMHDYLNIDTLPVTVPASDVARKLARDINADVESTWTPEAVEHLRLTLLGKRQSEEDIRLTCPSTEDLYIRAEQEQGFLRGLQEQLNSDEQLLVYMRFNENLSQEECAEFWGKSRQWVTKQEKSILNKIRSIVASMQH